jgi:hypothetical protein
MRGKIPDRLELHVQNRRVTIVQEIQNLLGPLSLTLETHDWLDCISVREQVTYEERVIYIPS